MKCQRSILIGSVVAAWLLPAVSAAEEPADPEPTEQAPSGDPEALSADSKTPVETDSLAEKESAAAPEASAEAADPVEQTK